MNRYLYRFVNGTKGGVYMTPSQAEEFYSGNHMMLPMDFFMSLTSPNWPKSISDGKYLLETA